MKELYFPDYESMSRASAEEIFTHICENPTASICLATGSTPTLTYRILSQLSATEPGKFAAVRPVKLDEWGGLPQDHEATCQYYLRNYFLIPLKIPPERFVSFRADATDRMAELERVSRELNSIGRLDLCVLGLGINGHLGFNEPAPYLHPHAHIADLTAQTQQHPMVQSMAVKPTFGYTLGMADLLQSRRILLLVNGSHKLRQLQRLLEQKISTEFPASFLHLHPDVTLFSDVRPG